MRTTEELITDFLSGFFRRNSKNGYVSDERREIFVNQPLPDNLLDPKTNLPKTVYPRNKIRTTKYTPLNFLPRNIFFQFTNIANSYFLFIIILGCFQIFGVQSPGMSAVPLIVIVVLTAIKDAFEDYRRAVSDYDLNSSKVHRLEGLNNYNVIEDNVGPWRKFKKACSRMIRSVLLGRSKKQANNNVVDLESIRSSMSTNIRTNFQNSVPFTPNTLSDPTVEIIPGLIFRSTQWKDVAVGDFLKVRKNEEIPSDVVILSTSNDNGVSYVETKNLDGETNLKPKNSLRCSSFIRRISDINRCVFSIEMGKPTKELYKFRGVLHYKSFSSINDTNGIESSESITIDNVLLRGSILRNTNYAICCVVATGDETKIVLNSGITPTKKSKISQDLNTYVFVNFILLFILCFVSGLVNGLFYRDTSGRSRNYFDFEPYAPTAAANGTLTFFVVLIMYQTLVPISLYITIEIIKTIQAYFIYADIQMYYDHLDFPCTPKSWGISDDLGQIEYVFSDKTGTLTQNVMEFKKCSVGGKKYGISYTAAQQGLDKRSGNINVENRVKEMNLKMEKNKEHMVQLLRNSNPFFHENELTFISSEFVEELAQNGKNNSEFLSAMALCHTAVIDTDRPDSNQLGYIHYSAESPDEIALVSAARDLGVVFLGKENDKYLLFKNEQEYEYIVLAVIPFDSIRKRMSIIFKRSDNSIVMFIKGADNIIWNRLVSDKNNEITKNDLSGFAEEGLRTLCVAKKELTKEEFDSWWEKYSYASRLVDENRETEMERLADDFENGFTLLGATAIEDKLQDGVPETIESLRKAGIKFWVLTGDKVETAISIGFSCSLLNNNMELLIIKESIDSEELEKIIDGYLIENFNIDPNDKKNIKIAKQDHSIPNETTALVVDGHSLTTLFENSTIEIQLKFLILCKKCCSIVCCRVSPSQKASIVNLVKKNLNVITLAIGDGANDVSMIQAANVGVGIAGEEGRQAAMSSDYAIGQFRYLNRLLLIHGRLSYQRLSEMIPCFFYKNIIFVMPLFWYGIFTNFDGTYLYEYTLLMLYNLFFTSIPVITLGTLDQDVPHYVSLAVPQLYRPGILHEDSSVLKFIIYIIDGLYQSVICFFFPWLIFRSGIFANEHGLPINGRFLMGNFSAHIAIISCNTYVLLRQKRWDWLTVLLYLLSIAMLFIWIGAWSSSHFSNNYFKSGIQVYQSASFWACMFIGILSSMLPRFLWDVMITNFFPNDVDIIREQIKDGKFEKDNDIENSGGFDGEEHLSELKQEKASSTETDQSFPAVKKKNFFGLI